MPFFFILFIYLFIFYKKKSKSHLYFFIVNGIIVDINSFSSFHNQYTVAVDWVSEWVSVFIYGYGILIILEEFVVFITLINFIYIEL